MFAIDTFLELFIIFIQPLRRKILFSTTMIFLCMHMVLNKLPKNIQSYLDMFYFNQNHSFVPSFKIILISIFPFIIIYFAIIALFKNNLSKKEKMYNVVHLIIVFIITFALLYYSTSMVHDAVMVFREKKNESVYPSFDGIFLKTFASSNGSHFYNEPGYIYLKGNEELNLSLFKNNSSSVIYLEHNKFKVFADYLLYSTSIMFPVNISRITPLSAVSKYFSVIQTLISFLIVAVILGELFATWNKE